MTARDLATERQVQAADPGMSTWLSANAGSGKTRVLTDRVARLLLEGVRPERILCLTYTKAAASEMQNRLFKRLGAWAMMPEAKLRDELEKLGAEMHSTAEALANARTLFARAIETPGGLKIQTIHSFCASLLRRFPLEAGVSPQFTEIDDRAATLLRAEVLEDMADGPDLPAVDTLAAHYTGDSVDALTGEIVRHRTGFAGNVSAPDVWAMHGLAAGFGWADLQSMVYTGGEDALLAGLLPALRSGSKTDKDAAEKLAALSSRPAFDETLRILASVFLFAGGKTPGAARIGKFPTKDTAASIPALMPALEALMTRVETAEALRKNLASAEKTLALHEFARAFLKRYEARKAARGWLDFDDLIHRAAALLVDPAVAAWVLFRLDGGIDHILVDEAQDTSPAQWRIVELLAQEFTAGEGARPDTERTLFVVGDKKQSIYAFQGADPSAFDRMRELFRERFGAIDAPFQGLQLEHSFRSSRPILEVTDATLEGQDGAGFGSVLHRAFHEDVPGRVDLWPLIPAAEKQDKGNWYDPVDRPAPEHQDIRLAAAIAEAVEEMIAHETLPVSAEARRSIRPGDILILVRSRGRLFHEIIRACKAKGLPMAGADRLRIGGELAVRDLSALLAFLATPEDDLSLACALRSPLFGWSEAMLFDLAHGRGNGFLWTELRSRTEYAETRAVLDALRSDADFLRPFELLERILTRHSGRERLLARLGAEAEDGIDAMLAQALAYERMDVPSLTGFLTWLDSGQVEIKRQVDAASDRIRVMTVHGAKGLEAPVVILPDTVSTNSALRDAILVTEDGTAIWPAKKEDQGKLTAETLAREKVKQAEERLRLLYVAMTRAERWLIVCGAEKERAAPDTWYSLVDAGIQKTRPERQHFSVGVGLRVSHLDWEAAPIEATTEKATPQIALPDWAGTPAAAPDRPPKTLAPSDLGGAKALPGDYAETDTDVLKRGRQLHRLLEYLPAVPEGEWPEQAAALLAFGEDRATPDDARALLDEAAAVLRAPGLRFLFDGNALAEVPVSADLPELGGRLHGTIDRLLIEADRVVAIDFKSNAIVPAGPAEIPEGLRRQMAAYAAALAQVYPGRTIEAALLWTRTAQLMPVPHESLRLGAITPASS